MSISARNAFSGKISKIKRGAVNAEIELSLPGGDQIVAIVTEDSLAELGIAIGKAAVAYVKAPWVMLLSGPQSVCCSARNQLAGTVSSLRQGAVSTEVGLTLPSGNTVFAIVTNAAIDDLGLREGSTATALIKASHVLLEIPG